MEAMAIWFLECLKIVVPLFWYVAPVFLVLLLPAIFAMLVPILANMTGSLLPWNFMIEAVRWSLIVVLLGIMFYSIHNYFTG